jgi:tetratricopeptide (TPR) repeat protein
MQSIENIELTLNLAEQRVRSGQSKEARALVIPLVAGARKMRPEHLIKMGNIFRRTGDFFLTTKLLHGLARPDDSMVGSERNAKIKSLASIEYGAALVQMGLISEAREILGSIDASVFPLALMHQALAMFQERDYAAAIPMLERLALSSRIDDYQRLVARVNLYVACCFAAPHKLTTKMIDELGDEIRINNYTLLAGVWSQIMGRHLTFEGRYGEAQTIFGMGLQQLKNVETYDRFYLQQWNLVCASFLTRQLQRSTKEIREPWRALKAQALGAKDYETTRECDYFLARELNDAHMLSHCFHGSPYKGFRARFSSNEIQSEILISLDAAGRISSAQHSNHQNGELTQRRFLDPLAVKDSDRHLSHGHLSLLLNSLLIDFYRPMTLPRIFQNVFLKQHWNPLTSPVQVRQTLFRLRQWLHQGRCGLQILEDNGNYFLASKRGLAPLRWSSFVRSRGQHIRDELREKFGLASFTFAEFSQIAKGSLCTRRRLIKGLIQGEYVSVANKTRRVRYKVI